MLDRFPVLSQTSASHRVRAWRQQQAYRRHPRRMASWFCDRPDLRTRVCVSNLELPEAPERCVPTTVEVTLLNCDEARMCHRRFDLRRNAHLRVELHDLLPAGSRDHVPSGQVRIDFAGAELGSSRAYLQWYNRLSVASSHEKFGFGLGFVFAIPAFLPTTIAIDEVVPGARNLLRARGGCGALRQYSTYKLPGLVTCFDHTSPFGGPPLA